MRIYEVLFPCLLLAGACQPAPTGQHPPTTARHPTTAAKRARPSEKGLADSLFKYQHLTEFFQRDDSLGYVLYGKETKAGKRGAAALDDSVLLVFQGIGRQYKCTSRLRLYTSALWFEEPDLNGDGRADLVVSTTANMHGQPIPYVFMSDKQGVLHYREDVSMLGVAYDPKKKLVQSFFIGGAFDVHSKEVYRWEHDSLRQLAGAELDLPHSTVRLYRLRHGQKHYYLTSRGEKAEEVYDTALFKPY